MRGSDSTQVESDPRQDKARLVDPDPRHASPRSRQRASGDASSTDYEIGESPAAHASRRSRRSLLSMRLLCFNKLDLILRRPPTGRANARPMTGSVAVSKDGLQYRFVIPGTRIGEKGEDRWRISRPGARPKHCSPNTRPMYGSGS